MKLVITAVIAVGLILGIFQLSQYWEQTKERQQMAKLAAAPPEPSGDALPGLPPKLQSAYASAQQRGAAGLRDFLALNATNVADPRLADIQLDFVLLVTQSDPGQARKVFAKVKARLTPDSPVYNRMKRLETTYD